MNSLKHIFLYYMSCVVNGIDVIYTDNKLYKFNKSGSIRELRGSIINTGYRQVSINKKTYYYHRVVYKCCNPEWDIKYNKTNQIDHIDQNKLNNNINNLRVVNNIQNNQNRGNVKGYYWNKKNKKWKAQIKINYKEIYLGYYLTEEEARNAYLEARKRYNFV